MDMPTSAQLEEVPAEDGSTSEKLHVEFTNGSLQQLRELGAFFDVKSDDPSEVVKLAISFLQNLKDRSSTPPKGTTTKED
jgi:hypothetical protein